MREKHRVDVDVDVDVDVITCDICHNEIDEGDVTEIPMERSLVTPFDVCEDCYRDLEKYFREKFKEEEG